METSNPSDAHRATFAEAAPFSAGTRRPDLIAPPGACDCHMHIYDARFPVDPRAPRNHPDASVADYHRLQTRLGLTRTVVVTPSTYGTDNGTTLMALEQFGTAARGVAVVMPNVTDAELARLATARVRGLRLNLKPGGITTIDMLAPLAARIGTLGWHIQVLCTADELVAHEAVFAASPVPVVFDHLASIDAGTRVHGAAMATLDRLLGAGHTWVKVSGAYYRTAPSHDVTELARHIIARAPDRVVWGSDWPHPTLAEKPDDADLFDLLLAWAPDPAQRRAILVDNPAQLYRF